MLGVSVSRTDSQAPKFGTLSEKSARGSVRAGYDATREGKVLGLRELWRTS